MTYHSQDGQDVTSTSDKTILKVGWEKHLLEFNNGKTGITSDLSSETLIAKKQKGYILSSKSNCEQRAVYPLKLSFKFDG